MSLDMCIIICPDSLETMSFVNIPVESFQSVNAKTNFAHAKDAALLWREILTLKTKSCKE